MRLKKTFIIFLICLILLNLSLVYAININNTSNKYFRIHIVANSDSIDDQLLKYTIAKQVNEYTTELTKHCKTKQQSKLIIKENIQSILQLCNNILKANNSSYSIKAYLGKQLYEEKQMNNIHMDSGIYDSLKIVIGNGAGQNWWSLIYPTTFSGESVQEIFDDETNYSFGIIQLIQKFFI